MTPVLSVIIPTHKRAQTLAQCLRHLEAQTIANDIEVIVMNDVPDDKEFERTANDTWRIPIHFETLPPCQQGIARNRGVQKARASTVLFIGDDIFLKPDVCALHVSLHDRFAGHAGNHPALDRCPSPNPSPPIAAVLGSSRWDATVGITPVMEWLIQSGWQFGYPKIEQYAGMLLPTDIQHLFCYTAHISVPTEVAVRIPFREDVKLYGWEDIEWGMRLKDAGVRVYYEPQAIAEHHHRITMEQSLARMETIGTSAALLKRSVPEFDRVPHGWKRIAYEIFARFPTMAGKHRTAFLKGIRRAEQSITN